MAWTWWITVTSLIGTIANIYKRRWCFWIWLVSNSCWAVIDWRHGLDAQAVLMLIYVLLAVWRLLQWAEGGERSWLSRFTCRSRLNGDERLNRLLSLSLLNRRPHGSEDTARW